MGYHTPAEQSAIRHTVVLQADHTNCIPRSELPGLPAWAIGKPIEELLGDSAYWKFQQDGMTRHEFLAALLNTCYPAPTATGNGAGK